MSLAGLVFCLIFLEMSNEESSHKWFVFFFLIWADGYTYLKSSFHFAEGKMHFSFGNSKSRHLVCWVWGNSFFGPAVLLSHNNSIKQEGKQKTKKEKKKKNRNPQQLALACLPYETP